MSYLFLSYFSLCCPPVLPLIHFYFGFAAQGNIEEVDVGPEEEAADVLVFQEVER